MKIKKGKFVEGSIEEINKLFAGGKLTMTPKKVDNRYDKIKVDCGCEKNVFACHKHAHMPSDTVMENIAILDWLKRDGWSETLIDRVEKSLSSHKELVEGLKGCADIMDNCEGAPQWLTELINKAEGK
jgi:hypothetical protein